VFERDLTHASAALASADLLHATLAGLLAEHAALRDRAAGLRAHNSRLCAASVALRKGRYARPAAPRNSR
jgi:hypothetical protein